MIVNKESLQKDAVELSRQYNNLMLLWATGCGKTQAAIKIQDYHNSHNTLIVVAETAHINVWKEEYIKCGKEYLLDKTDILCYASLKHKKDTKIDILILDEGHHATTDIRSDILSTIKADKVIVLSATLDKQKEELFNSIFGRFHKFEVSLSDAIKFNILPRPKIITVPLELTRFTRDTQIVITRGKSKLHKVIFCELKDRWKYMMDKENYPNLKLIISASLKEKYLYLCEQFDYYKRAYLSTRRETIKNKWMRIGSERKLFLADSKTKYIQSFIEKLRDSNKRFVCFCGSIKQAELLGSGNSIHSKKKNSLEIIKDFNSKKINNLFAVNMIQEGQNLLDIQLGIIVQLDGTERPFIQKLGRVFRAEDPTQIIFYFKGTRDEEYLSHALECIDSRFIYKVNSIKELDYEMGT